MNKYIIIIIIILLTLLIIYVNIAKNKSSIQEPSQTSYNIPQPLVALKNIATTSLVDLKNIPTTPLVDLTNIATTPLVDLTNIATTPLVTTSISSIKPTDNINYSKLIIEQDIINGIDGTDIVSTGRVKILY
jgi:hypothetical protein